MPLSSFYRLYLRILSSYIAYMPLFSSLYTLLSSDVLRINHRDQPTIVSITVTSSYFVAQHPFNRLYYTGEYDSSKIMKIDPATNTITQILIRADIGQTPVGMVTGTKAICFTLLGSTTKEIRTIVGIGAADQITWFKFTSLLGSNATLLHLAFDVDHINNYTLRLIASFINYPKLWIWLSDYS
jgi:hypothetical protein